MDSLDNQVNLNIGDRLHDGDEEWRIAVLYPEVQEVDIRNLKGHFDRIDADLARKMLVSK